MGKLHVDDEEGSDDEFDWRGDQNADVASADTRTASMGGLERYKAFERKFKRIAHADYKDTKIHISYVLASLWEKHKELYGYGSKCNENCPCLHSLSALSTDVIKRHVVKQKKSMKPMQSEHEIENRVAGVMKFFAPVFLPKLKESYPDETPTNLLDRLCDMWLFHTRAPLYGVRCSEKCECREEWTDLFAQGNAQKMDKLWSSRRVAGKKHSALIAANAASSQTGVASIPRKRRDASKLSSSIATLTLPATQTPEIPDIARKNSVVHPSRRAPTSQSFSFEVALDSSQALGGYFKTAETSNGYTYAQIESVCPVGQLARDRRIGQGTCVEAVLNGETRKIVGNHAELKHYFEVAKRRKRPLKLIFVNHGVKSETGPKENDWDANGDWTGTVEGVLKGWAGGAMDRSKPEQAASSTSAPKETISLVAKEKQSDNNQWEACVNERQLPDPSKFPLKSCLTQVHTKESIGKKAKKSGRKKIHFSEAKNEVVIFDTDHPTNVKVVERISKSTQANSHVPERSQEEILFEALQTGSCKDLIDLLQSGIITSPSVVKTALVPNYNYLKERISKIDVSTADMAKVRQNMDAKALVMKIFTNCAFLIAKAMSLTRFFELQIDIVELAMEKTVNAKQSLEGSSVCQGKVSVLFGDGKKYAEVLGTLPARQFAEKMAYDDCSFTAHNNSAFGMEDRKLLIEVEEKPLQNTLPASRLGSAIFELDTLEQKCFTGGTSVEVTVPISIAGVLLSHGEARIAVKKTQVGEEYIGSKREEVLQALHVQIKNIHHFNEQWSQICGAKLSGNIEGIDGLTLLHAAVHLGEPVLTKELMDLGANARHRSRLGTPLHFAQQMLEKVLEKEKNLEAKNAPSEALIRQRERCAQAKHLADMLHDLNQVEETVNDISSAGAHKDTTNFATESSELGEDQVTFINQKRFSRHNLSGELRLGRSDEDKALKHCELEQTRNGSDNGLTESVPLQHPAASLDRDGSSNGSINRNDPSFQQNLPKLPSVAWVKCPLQGNKYCLNNLQRCWHFEKGKCNFLHTVLSPLLQEEMEIKPVFVPNMNSQWIMVKQMGEFWTAAFTHMPSRRVIYAQDVFRQGFRSSQGIWWFNRRVEAENALTRTFAILHQLENSRRSRQSRGYDSVLPPKRRDSMPSRR
jgi:hypothetical protein